MAHSYNTLKTLEMLVEYYNKDISPGQLDIYEQALSDIPDAVLLRAAQEHIKGKSALSKGDQKTTPGVFFPKVSELRALAQMIKDDSVFMTQHIEFPNLRQGHWDCFGDNGRACSDLNTLEDDAYLRGKVDDEAWKRLIVQLQKEGRLNMLDRTVRRYEYLKGMVANDLSN